MYKVLDVREFITTEAVSYNRSSYGGSINSKNSCLTVVIAEDEQGERTRFEFYPAHKEEFLGYTHYYGTKGDYDVLIPGDKFELIMEVDTWPFVKLIKEDK